MLRIYARLYNNIAMKSIRYFLVFKVMDETLYPPNECLEFGISDCLCDTLSYKS